MILYTWFCFFFGVRICGCLEFHFCPVCFGYGPLPLQFLSFSVPKNRGTPQVLSCLACGERTAWSAQSFLDLKFNRTAHGCWEVARHLVEILNVLKRSYSNTTIAMLKLSRAETSKKNNNIHFLGSMEQRGLGRATIICSLIICSLYFSILFCKLGWWLDDINKLTPTLWNKSWI